MSSGGQKVSGEKSPRPVPQRFITATSRLVCGLAVCTRASTAAVTGTSCLRTTLIPSTRRGIAKTSAENQNDVRRGVQVPCPFPVVSPARPLALELFLGRGWTDHHCRGVLGGDEERKDPG